MKRTLAQREAPLTPLLLTGAEAARLLRVSRRTLWSYTAPRGGIRPVRFGRNLRYSPAELARWIAEQLAEQPPDSVGEKAERSSRINDATTS